MSNKRFLGFTEFSNWVLGKVSEVLTTVDTQLSNTVNKDDDFGQYKVGELELSALLADLASGADLNTLQQSFEDFVAAKASTQEAIAGTDDAKYLTAVGAKAAIEAAVNDLVGSAPEAMNTIMELATALENNPDIISELTTLVGQKLDVTATAVNSNKLEGSTKAQVVAEAATAVQPAINNKLDATAQAADSVLFQGRTKAQVVAEATAAVQPSIDAKLDATATAVNSNKLEGSTKAQVIASARQDLATQASVTSKLDATATAVNSSKLEGATKVQIILEAIAAADLDSKLDVTASTEFATAAQGVKADTAVQPDVLQTALNTKLNVSGYTAGDILAKLLTVDGPNSGLDADALDGKQLATIEAEYKAFTNVAISALVDSSPDALNTLNELATALGNDPNFATTITNQLASKVDKTDTRLTDAREWSAITITQPEAETGVATTRRAWTAQRVRQAIAAWWTGSADKTKLDGIAAGAQVNVPTNLGYTTSPTAGTVTSSTGTNVSLPGSTTAAAGLLSAVDKVKLNGISEGATVNSADATLLSRSNHTGTQSISTVSGLQTALDSKLSSTAQAADSAKLEGKTFSQVSSAILATANLGTASTADIYVSTVDPTSTDGNDGDIWIKYTP